MAEIRGYRRPFWDTQPEYLFPHYLSTITRAPSKPLVIIPQTLSEITAPVFGYDAIGGSDNDLTRHHEGQPIGERMVVSGRVMDENGKPVRGALIEMWQANAAGRYHHEIDKHDAPLDPNFTGAGRILTDDDGRYRFMTIKPGSYPWRNHNNAWRPAHLHFSIFGLGLPQRLVTQMYFPGDPLLEYDPMYHCVADEKARRRLISTFDWENAMPEFALAYRFDIVLRGREETPMENFMSGLEQGE